MEHTPHRPSDTRWYAMARWGSAGLLPGACMIVLAMGFASDPQSASAFSTALAHTDNQPVVAQAPAPLPTAHLVNPVTQAPTEVPFD